MLFPGAGVDQVEVPLRRGVDQHVAGILAHPQRTHVLARPAELMDEVVQDRPGRGNGGGRIGTAEAIERMNPEVLAQHLPRGIRKEGIAVVRLRCGQLPEDGELFIGDQDLGRREACQFVIE